MRMICTLIFLLGPLLASAQTSFDSTTIVCPVETMPRFPDEFGEMAKFISKNLKYPDKLCCVEGKVFVQFVVDEDGSICSVKTVRGIHPLCDAEAERVVKLFPKWIPGRYAGENVAVKMVVPISFRLTH